MAGAVGIWLSWTFIITLSPRVPLEPFGLNPCPDGFFGKVMITLPSQVPLEPRYPRSYGVAARIMFDVGTLQHAELFEGVTRL